MGKVQAGQRGVRKGGYGEGTAMKRQKKGCRLEAAALGGGGWCVRKVGMEPPIGLSKQGERVKFGGRTCTVRAAYDEAEHTARIR